MDVFTTAGSSHLTVSVCQFDVQTGDVDTNIKTGLDAARQACRTGAGLVVMPELWSCGYAGDQLKHIAEKTPAIVKALGALARDHGAVIAGSLPEKSGSCLHNTLFVIDHQGQAAAAYRKIHLFPLLNEDKWFAPGTQSLVFECQGVLVGCMLCYDLRFAEMGVHLAAAGARVLVVCAQWPAVRIDHWDLLLAARAVENQVFVAAANCCNADPDPEYNGHSRIIAPDGSIMADAGQTPGCSQADVAPGVIDEMRSRFAPVCQRTPGAYPPLLIRNHR